MIRRLFNLLRRASGQHPWLNRAMRMAAQFMRQRPWIYPAGVIVSAARWIDSEHVAQGWYARQRTHWYAIMYPESLRAVSPPARGDMPWRFRDDLFRLTPEAGVFCLRGAYLLSDEGAVLSRDNQIFGEFVHHFQVSKLRQGRYFEPFRAFSLMPERRAEWIALLAAPEGKNYYHWLFDVLPRLHLLEKYRNQIELFAVPGGLTSVQLETLARLGVGRESFIELEANKKVYCERLIVPSLPGSEGSVPDWAVHFLRTSFLSGAHLTKGRRKILLSRTGARERRLANEAEIAVLLAARGFEIVDTAQMSFDEQVGLFREVAFVVGCHGAGLANVVFATDCKILELFSPEYFRPDCFYTLARQLGHQYDYLTGQPSGTGWGDIRVDALAVKKIVDGWA